MKQIEQGKVIIYEDSSSRILVKYLVNGLIDGLDIDLAVVNDGLQKLQIQGQLVINQHLIKQNQTKLFLPNVYCEIPRNYQAI
jgi:hypothetical protein